MERSCGSKSWRPRKLSLHKHQSRPIWRNFDLNTQDFEYTYPFLLYAYGLSTVCCYRHVRFFLKSSALQDLLLLCLHESTTRWQQATVQSLEVRSLRSFLPQWHQHLSVHLVYTKPCWFEIAKWPQEASEWKPRRRIYSLLSSWARIKSPSWETIPDISDTSKSCEFCPWRDFSYRIFVKPHRPVCTAFGIC